jgi:hypothetical protein
MNTYPVKISICLRPIFYADAPEYRISAADVLLQGHLESTTVFDLSIIAVDKSSISIEFLNKQDSDTVIDQGLDKAIVIEWIKFFGISDPRFVWQGVYRPNYPEPWYSQQLTAPPETLKNTDYLSWNGKWSLDFDVPIFLWIHRIQNHGWLYT